MFLWLKKAGPSGPRAGAQIEQRARRSQPLPNVEKGGGLVNDIQVCGLHADKRNRKALQLAAGECIHRPLPQVSELQLLHNNRAGCARVLLLQHRADMAARVLGGHLLDVLRLGRNARLAGEQRPDSSAHRRRTDPVLGRRRCTKVGLKAAREDGEYSGLAASIGTQNAEDLRCPRAGEPVQPEGVPELVKWPLLGKPRRRVLNAPEETLVGKRAARLPLPFRFAGHWGCNGLSRTSS